MKKEISISFIILLLTISCTTFQNTIEVPETVDLPQRIFFLAQSGTANELYQSVIDLNKNELVILYYSGPSLLYVIRTGMQVDPDDYLAYHPSGTDAPFAKTEVETDTSDDTSNSNSSQ